MYQVIGMRVVSFTNQRPCSMEEQLENFNDRKYEIVMIETETSQLFTLTGFTTHGWCGSGYSTATWGKLLLKEAEIIGSLHYTPINYIEVDEYDIQYHTIENALFYFSKSGMDECYPSGKFEIKLNGWRATGRLPSKEMIHIFYGESCTGKSTLAEMLGQKLVIESDGFYYENDFYSRLKRLPHQDEEVKIDKVIVIGNKLKIDLKTVKNILKDHYTIVMVNFDWG